MQMTKHVELLKVNCTHVQLNILIVLLEVGLCQRPYYVMNSWRYACATDHTSWFFGRTPVPMTMLAALFGYNCVNDHTS